MAKIEKNKKFHKDKENLILTEYGISCDLFDFCRRFSSLPDQAVKELRRANKCPPRLLINSDMIVYVSQVYSQHNEVLIGIF